jgi:hypothetical protein
VNVPRCAHEMFVAELIYPALSKRESTNRLIDYVVEYIICCTYIRVPACLPSDRIDQWVRWLASRSAG